MFNFYAPPHLTKAGALSKATVLPSVCMSACLKLCILELWLSRTTPCCEWNSPVAWLEMAKTSFLEVEKLTSSPYLDKKASIR